MDINERIEISKKRNYIVSKANKLIQNSRYKLSLPEQKTVAFICSMIKPDENKLDYEFNIRDYCKVCGIDYDSGKNYVDVRAILKKLRDNSMYIALNDNDDTESTVSWLSKVRVSKSRGIVHISIDSDLAPYLFNLNKFFTQYHFLNIVEMKSAFSVRIYELMKSYANLRVVTFDIDELKRLLMVDNVKSYANFKDFRVKVLEKAQAEINELTDMQISFEPILQGRKVVKVKFKIKIEKA